MIKVKVKSIREAKSLKEWFSEKDFRAMDASEQEQYLKDHPNSKFQPDNGNPDTSKNVSDKNKEVKKDEPQNFPANSFDKNNSEDVSKVHDFLTKNWDSDIKVDTSNNKFEGFTKTFNDDNYIDIFPTYDQKWRIVDHYRDKFGDLSAGAEEFDDLAEAKSFYDQLNKSRENKEKKNYYSKELSQLTKEELDDLDKEISKYSAQSVEPSVKWFNDFKEDLDREKKFYPKSISDAADRLRVDSKVLDNNYKAILNELTPEALEFLDDYGRPVNPSGRQSPMFYIEALYNPEEWFSNAGKYAASAFKRLSKEDKESLKRIKEIAPDLIELQNKTRDLNLLGEPLYELYHSRKLANTLNNVRNDFLSKMKD